MKNPFYRKPDEDLKRANGADYLHRWWIIPRNRVLNIYLHKFLGDDADDVLHDHPWPSWSLILRGKYIERLPDNKVKIYRRGNFIYRPAGHAHRIKLFKDKVYKPVEIPPMPEKFEARNSREHDMVDAFMFAFAERSANPPLVLTKVPRRVWTLFITGRKVREWGFHCESGWVHWKMFTSKGGCGE